MIVKRIQNTIIKIDDSKPKIKISSDLRSDIFEVYGLIIPEFYYPFTMERIQ